VRQTLFDWLAPVIEGARCLDLFAGSGALGLEALSRGAAHVTFVDAGGAQCAAIRAALQKLGAADRADVFNEDALTFLAPQAGRGSYDVVFLDPPFDAALLAPALERLPRLLTPDNRVYVERHQAGAWSWPAGYAPLREKKAGQVSYALATFTGTQEA
jgi:16S rRNA (guanine966-N2)-methyltransferase